MYSHGLLPLFFSGCLAYVPFPIRGLFRFKMNALPTIVLVPGAFHLQPAMDIFSYQLRKMGYDTQSFGLATVNSPKLTIQDDVAALVEKVLYPLIEMEGKDVLLYLHSYAGFPGSAAIEGYSKAERRAEGKRGGIIGLIYQSAFIPTQGDSLLQMIGGQYAPWQDPNVRLKRALIHTPSRIHINTVRTFRNKPALLARSIPKTPSGPTWPNLWPPGL